MATNRRPDVRARMFMIPYSSWIVIADRSGNWSGSDIGTFSEVDEGSDALTCAAVVVEYGW